MNRRTRKNMELIRSIFQENDRAHVLYFSSLNSTESVVRQFLALEVGANPDDFRDPIPITPAVRSAAEKCKKWDFYIYANPKPTLKDVVRMIQDVFLKCPLDVIVFDTPFWVRNDKKGMGK